MRRQITVWEQAGPSDINLFVNEPAGPNARFVTNTDYDTFISHKGQDLNLAVALGALLHANGINGYLDRWDPAVDGDSIELEEHLRGVIRDTPSILAVITENTTTSWWVPFEIGVVRETGSQIATFIEVDENRTYPRELPSYLQAWPILASYPEVVAWAKSLIRLPPQPPHTQRRILMEDTSRLSSALGSNREIHRLQREGKVRFTR